MFLVSDYLLWNSFYVYADLFFRTGFRTSNTAVDECVLANLAHKWRPAFALWQLLGILVVGYFGIGDKGSDPSR